MKILLPRLSDVSLDDWFEYHPYRNEVPSDHYYITLCNDIQDEIIHIDVNGSLVGADYKYLSIALVCYFEDIISKTGIWTSFINAHHQLYGKYLPFYDTSTDYKYGDVNVADLKFLIWHFCSNLSIHNHLIDPYSLDNEEMAMIVYGMLDEEIGKAVVNEHLRKQLLFPEENDLYRITPLLTYLYFNSYLNYYYMTTRMEEISLELKNKKGIAKSDLELLKYNRKMEFLFNSVTPLLAQRSTEMSANRCGRQHPQYANLLSASEWREGLFRYIDSDATCVQVEHAFSGTRIRVRNNGDEAFRLLRRNDLLRLGLVLYADDWWLMSAVVRVDNPGEISEKDRALIKVEDVALGIIKRQEICFLETNNNERLFFTNNKRGGFSLIDNVWDLYHRRYGNESADRKLFDVYALTFDVDDDLENLTVFFNAKTGMEFYPDVAQYIYAGNNPYFDPKEDANIEHLLFDEHISTEFVAFLIENELIEIEPTSGSEGFPYVRSNYDFILRYWKKEHYKLKPKVKVEY
jgi:hypothetical protein